MVNLNNINKLKGFRGLYNLSQKDIAKLLSISRNSYIKRENEKKFKYDEMLKILEFAKKYNPNIEITDLFF